MAEPRAELLHLFTVALEAVDGERATARALPGLPAPDLVLAVGKAAASMMRAAQERFGPVPGLVVTKDGHGAGLPPSVRLIEASHPVPDARSLEAGRALVEAVAGLGEAAHLLLLVSGGASALAEDPAEGMTLADLSALNERLLAGGLDIGAMNAERRRVSRIKGGGLLARFGGKSAVTLAISDVPRDEIAVIGSGIGMAPAERGFDWRCQIVASNSLARQAALREAADLGHPPLGEEETLYGDVGAVAARLGPRLRGLGRGVLVLGGEPTVTLPPDPGEGGRNQALALALARELAGTPGLTVLVAGSDGTDGPTEAAGAIVDGTTWGPGAEAALEGADSGRYLDARGARLVTGPTGTNVMDLLIAIRS